MNMVPDRILYADNSSNGNAKRKSESDRKIGISGTITTQSGHKDEKSALQTKEPAEHRWPAPPFQSFLLCLGEQGREGIAVRVGMWGNLCTVKFVVRPRGSLRFGGVPRGGIRGRLKEFTCTVSRWSISREDQNLKLTVFHRICCFLHRVGSGILDLAGRWHEAIPVGRRFPEVRHNFPNFWSQFHLTIPASSGEIPQRIRKPDS